MPLRYQLDIISAGTDDNLDTAFNSLDQLRARALLIGTNSFFNSHTERACGARPCATLCRQSTQRASLLRLAA